MTFQVMKTIWQQGLIIRVRCLYFANTSFKHNRTLRQNVYKKTGKLASTLK